MKVLFNAFLILAAGAAAYFSFDQSKKFAAQQEAPLQVAGEDATMVANATATEKESKDEQALLVSATQERDLVLQGITALKSTETSLKRDIAGIDANLETQKQEFVELEKAVEELNRVLVGMGGGVTVDNIGDKIVEIETDLKAKKARMDELTTLIDAAQKKIATTRSESDRLTDRAIESNVRVSRNALEAVVTAVNQDWGFLVIGAGSNSGFTPQTALLVKRDGKLIGRVRPTSVEATQTIADIDLDSLAAGVRIQPGDRVIVASPATN